MDHNTEVTTKENRYGYCKCGCGQLTPIAKKTIRGRGHVKGEPMPYMHSHTGLRLRSIYEAFSRHFVRGDPNECWIWIGAKTRGYGSFRYEGKSYYAHRYSYEYHVGPIPEGMECCHKCDNPACCNYSHYFIGSHRDNMADMAAKGRNVTPNLKGAEHPRAKFTNEEIVSIREEFAYQGVTAADIARHRNVAKGTILFIVHGEHWSDVGGPISPKVIDRKGETVLTAKLTEAKVLAIREEYATGKIGSIRLAKKYGVAKPTILRVIHRKTWAHI